jgi:hypothetical protein
MRNEFFKRKAREAKERKKRKEGKATEPVNGGLLVPTAPGGISPSVRPPSQEGEGASEATNKNSEVKERDSFSNITFDYRGKTIRVREPVPKGVDEGVTFMSYKFSLS